MGGVTIINRALGQAVQEQQPPVPNGNPAQPQQNIQNQQKDVSQENQEAANENKETRFDPLNFGWGLVKGAVKEVFNMIIFIPKLIFNLFTKPKETIKGLATGFSNLFKLIFNPRELMKTLSKAWENFCNADSDKKVEILGKIFANFVSVPVIGNPLLLNARLLSACRRVGVSTKAIIQNRAYLSEFYKTHGSKWKTFEEARSIARKANWEKDFERALKLEGIPKELAPKLVFGEMPVALSNLRGAYIPQLHTIVINTQKQNIFSSIYHWISGNSTSKIIRHEI